jgi:hypothetical protein
MMKTFTLPVFAYRDLTATAKQRALEALRPNALENDWFDWVYLDADQIAALMGITIDRQRRQRIMSYGCDPDILFSGFCSQGSGASFTERYAGQLNATVAVRDYASQDVCLHAIIDSIDSIQARHDHRLRATITRNDCYYVHENSVDIDVFGVDADGDEIDDAAVNAVSQDDRCALAVQLRAFMRWIYRQLDSEHDRLTSDEALADNAETGERFFSSKGDDITFLRALL